MSRLITKTIECDKCHEVIEFEEPEHSTSADTLPDGTLFNGNWYCEDCCYCQKCEHDISECSC